MNTVINRAARIIHLGLSDYQNALDIQIELFQKILDQKSRNRELPHDEQQATDNYLIFCEHPHVYTLGRNGDEGNLLIPKDELTSINATYFPTNRGGDITYHGPGQIIVYPVIDLENFFTDIHQYMRLLEESIIQTLSVFGVASRRIPGLTGVWCGSGDPQDDRKIAALGVKTSRWVTMHGLALNVNPDLTYFKNIIACGIAGKAVTSLEKESGKNPPIGSVQKILEEKIGTLFRMELMPQK